MKKTFFKFWVIILSCFMVLSNASLPSYSEDIGDNEKNDIANSFRYTDGETREGHSMSLFSRSAVDSSWPKDSKAIAKGIDVSTHNEKIDWKRVKQSGVDYAIIRCGYGNDDITQDDSQWYNNANACTRLGIPFGVYIYSYADTTDKAVSEAQHVLRLIQGYNLSFPIYLDMEDKVQAVLSDSERGNIASVFCNIIQNEGYKVGIYANKNWWTNYLTDSAFNNSLWYKWVAQYNSSCTYSGNYTMWQYTSSGYVNGINTNVDMNYWYGEYIDVNPVTVNTTVADSITESNATVRGTVAYSGQKPSEVGIYFGTSENGMSKVANDVINHNKNPFDMWYDLNDEAGLYLDSNTKYYWQCYAIVNGKEYKGEIKSFTTLNSSKPIKSIVCNSTVMKSTKKDVSYMLEVAITNLSAEDIKGIVIIVYRDKNGNIIKIHNGDIDIACNSKLTHSDSINGYTTISRADVYFFESLNNLVPISNNLECNFN